MRSTEELELCNADSLCNLRVHCVSVVNTWPRIHTTETQRPRRLRREIRKKLLLRKLLGEVSENWQFEILALVSLDQTHDPANQNGEIENADD